MSWRWLPRLAILAVLVGGLVAFRTLPVAEWIATIETWAAAHPVAAPLVYVIVTIVSVVLLTPGWIPMSLAGLLFGVAPGFVYALASMTAGAALALLAGRTLARDWVERGIEGSERMLALDDALEDEAFTIVVLTRLALVIPFNVLNYAYGLTRVRVPVFVVATAVGMVPIVAIYTYLGSVARDVGDIFSGEARLDAGAAWIAGIGVAVIVIVVIVTRRAVNRALDKRTARAKM